MQTLWQDLRYGARALAKKPGFTLIAVITLALGIGGTTAIFSFIDAMLLKDIPYRDSDQLVIVSEQSPEDLSTGIPSTPAFLEWRARSRIFSHLAGITDGRLNLTGRGAASLVNGAFVSANYFDMLGVRPVLGRSFMEGEDQPGRERVAVLTNRFWRARLGADPDVLGSTITLNNEIHTIIGVLPPAGVFERSPTDVWLPLIFTPEDIRNSRHFFTALARLKPGVTFEQANADLRRISEELDRQGRPYGKGYGAIAEPLRDNLISTYTREILYLLMGAILIVLLIASANVANLLLARATVRQREIFIRAAVGASRWRLVRQLLTESVLLAIISGTAGALLAMWLIEGLKGIWPRYEIPSEVEVTLDLRMLFFTLGVSLLTGLLFGAVPAWQATRFDLTKALREQSVAVSVRWRRNKARSLFLVTEVALTFVLVTVALLLIRSFTRLLQGDLGFQPESLLTMRTNLDRSRYPESAQLFAYQNELLNRLRALPSVEFAAAASALPFGGTYSHSAISIPGRSLQDHVSTEGVQVSAVSADYFNALGISLLRGRFIIDQDTAHSRQVIVINESLAKKYWPDRDPVGTEIRFVGDTFPHPFTIAGVVADTKSRGLDDRTRLAVYLPFAQLPEKAVNFYGRGVYFVARTRGDPVSLANTIQSLAADIDRDQPLYGVRAMDQLIYASVTEPRFRTFLFSLFGALALVLASVGIYGVISYAAAQRTHEIGIRMALGARPGNVLRLVMWQGIVLTFIGLAAGLGAALALTRLLRGFLYEITPTDAATFLAVTALLAGVALAACYVPARRAMKVDPIVALRCE